MKNTPFLSLLTIASITFLFSILTMASPRQLVGQKKSELPPLAVIDSNPAYQNQDKIIKVFTIKPTDTPTIGLQLNIAIYIDAEKKWQIFNLGNIADFNLVPSPDNGFLKLWIGQDSAGTDGNIVEDFSVLELDITQSENGIIEVYEQSH